MKRSTFVILVLLLIGLGLRIWSLAGQSFWWDEAFTYQTVSHGLGNLWSTLQAGDRNPPLYFLGLAVWGSLAGWSEYSLRFVSVIWCVVGLAFLYNLTKRVFNTQAGLWALAVAAVSPAWVVYSQEARMYAAFLALTTATFYFGVRSVANSPSSAPHARFRIPPFALFLICESALLLTHYFALPIVATINLFVLIALARKRAALSEYLKWLGSQLLVALPLMIWIILVFSTPGSLTLAHEPLPNFFTYAYQVLILWLTSVRDLAGAQMALILPAIILISIAFIGAWLLNRRSALLVLAFGCVSLVAAFGLVRVLTSFHPRYLLPYSIPALVLMGGALSNLRFDRRLRAADHHWTPVIAGWVVGGLTLLLTLSLWSGAWQTATSPNYAKDDARAVAAYLRQHAAAQDVILVEAHDYTLNYYDHGLAQVKMITAATEEEAFRQLGEAIGSAQHVWYAHWSMSTQDPRNYWRFLLEQAGSLKDWTSYHGYDLFRYDVQSPLREPVLSMTAPGSRATTYLDRWSGVDGQGGDGALTFAVAWRRDQAVPRWEKVSVSLVDAAGTRLSSVDAPLLDAPGDSAITSTSDRPLVNYYVLPIPLGTPPLTYTISARLYASGIAQPAEQEMGNIHLLRRLDESDPYRTLAGYQWETPGISHVAPGLDLEGFTVGQRSPRALDLLDVTLRWRKNGPASNVAPRLRLAWADRTWTEAGSDLLEHDYPVDQWVDGEMVIDRRKIVYPPVKGPLELQIGQGTQWLTLTTLSLDETDLLFQPPQIQHPQSAQFDDMAELLGFDLNSNTMATDRPLELTLYWRAVNSEPISTPYTVFTQMIAPDGHLVAQQDAPPDPPATTWVPGQVVEDRHSVKVVDPAYRGPATLIIGWYNSATIERVPVVGGGDYVTLRVPLLLEEK